MIRRKFFVAFVGALDVFCGDEVGAFEKFRLMKNPIGGDRPARMDSKSRREKKRGTPIERDMEVYDGLRGKRPLTKLRNM
jgi:hypothetical protein